MNRAHKLANNTLLLSARDRKQHVAGSNGRNVNLLLFQTGIRTVKKLVLALAIHDKDVTMAKAARASFTVRAGLALRSEERPGTKTHRHNELSIATLSKQRLIIAVPHHEGSGSQQSAHPPQHTVASSGVR